MLKRSHQITILSVCLLLSGCSGEPAKPPTPLQPVALRPEKVHGHVQVWSWNIAAKSLQKLVPAFHQKYPRVKVDVDMTGTNMQARFLLSLSAGVGAPDVMQLQMTEAPHYIATHRLADLTPVA